MTRESVSQDQARSSDPPPALVGYQLPPVLRRGNLDYVYFRSQESTPGEAALRVAVAPEPWPQVLAWVTPAALDGSVQVSVDGEVAARRPAGSFDEGVLLTRAWLAWCELWRSEEWLVHDVTELRARERRMLAEAHDFRVTRPDLDLHR